MKKNNLKISNKKNNLLAVIIVLMLLFPFKTIAQNIPNNDPVKTKILVEIKPTSTLKEFSQKKVILKKMFGVEINFSDIKMNKKKEIIAIKIRFDDNKGNKKTYQIEGLEPIKTFGVFAEKDEKEYLEMGFDF